MITSTYLQVSAGFKQKCEVLNNAYVYLIPRPFKDGVWEKDKELLNWLKSLGR